MQQNLVPIETKHTYCILSLRWQFLTMLYVTEFSHGEKSLICHVLAEAKHMTVAVRLWHIPLLFQHKPATKQMPNQIRRSIWYHPFWHAHLPGATFQSNWGHTGPCFLSSTLTAGTHTHTVSWAMAQSFCKWHDWNVKLSVSSYICLTTNGKARPQGMYKTVNQKLARSDFPKYARKCAVTEWSIITSRRWARFFARFCMRWVPSLACVHGTNEACCTCSV